MNVYTHGDFDGIVSAAIVGRVLPVSRTFFASPKTIAAQTVTEQDVVCDLPYPHRSVRYWFDHHAANIEAVGALGIAGSIAGRFVPAPSAAQVVYDFFRAEHAFPAFLAETVAEANRVDAMDYASVEEWLAPTPAHRINRALFLPNEGLPDARRYMLLLVRTIGKHPLADLAESDEVEARYALARRHEEESVAIIHRAARLLGNRREVLLLDFSEDRVAPRFSKNMAYTVHPEARAILHLAPGFKDGARTNAIRISLSANPFGIRDHPDVAAILGDLELGSGHPGAAGGTLVAESKERLLARKEATVAQIVDLWEQRRGT
jgi:hypothetical protein